MVIRLAVAQDKKQILKYDRHIQHDKISTSIDNSLIYGKMMTEWEETMKRMDYPYVMLSTQEDETAKHFYEMLGFHRIGAFLPPEQEADEIMYLKELKL